VLSFNSKALICAPLFNNAKSYAATEVVNNMSSEQFDDNYPATLRVTARFVSQALQQAEDITLMEGDES